MEGRGGRGSHESDGVAFCAAWGDVMQPCPAARGLGAWARRAFVEGQLEVRGAVGAREGQTVAVDIVAAEDGLVESLVLQQRQREIVALCFDV